MIEISGEQIVVIELSQDLIDDLVSIEGQIEELDTKRLTDIAKGNEADALTDLAAIQTQRDNKKDIIMAAVQSVMDDSLLCTHIDYKQ